MLKKIVLMSVVFVVALSVPAQATLLLADGFTYSDGNLVPNNGGYSAGGGDGWGGAWQLAIDYPCDPGDIGVSGNQVVTRPSIPGIIQGVERSMASTQGATTQYFGFDLKRYPGNPAGTLFGLSIDIPGSGGPTLLVIGIVSGNNWFLHGNIISGGVSGGGIYVPGVFHRVVGRIDFDKGGVNDELTCWVNPTAETDTPELIHHSENMGSTLNGLTLGIIGRDIYADPCWAFDRLNLTTDFASARDGLMVPEPATLVVLALGALVGLLRRSR